MLNFAVVTLFFWRSDITSPSIGKFLKKIFQNPLFYVLKIHKNTWSLMGENLPSYRNLFACSTAVSVLMPYKENIIFLKNFQQTSSKSSEISLEVLLRFYKNFIRNFFKYYLKFAQRFN